MKPLLQFDETLLDNKDQFKDDFFKRKSLRHADKPLELNDHVAKDYLFPTLYSDVTCAIGIFMCNYDKAVQLMPHPLMKPVKMPQKRSLVVFSCYIYKNVLGIPSYNEIAMTIPVLINPSFSPPVLPMIAEKMFPNFGYHVFSMPVTSLENQIRGNKIWGLPKVTQQIDMKKQGDYFVTTAMEESGETYFELSIPMEGKETHFDVSSNLYSVLDGELLQSETNFKADFNMNKYMKKLWNKNNKPNHEFLKLSDTPSGKLLQQLEMEQHPFQTRFAEGMNSSFDLSNPNYKAPK
ncbi:acetoacetate decarboxylase family protein [Longirhabdus pacifica]|uniref:acetoacetate decarboxylase family protein n=1 Tax=Longirhabdus pacifica TaxID=2305227 RepID=UPI0013E8DB85|nr:acetoacetate decarboxylase family protein [Longirhabdus pacifica]